MTFLFLFTMILIAAAIVNYKVYRLRISTVAGAPIMAMGIMTKSIFTESGAPSSVSDILFYFIIIMACWVITQYIFDLLQRVFYSLHIKNPIASFSTGTWVAALSVMTVLLADRHIHTLSHILFFSNLLLWLLYVGLIVRNYVLILKRMKHYLHHIHGVLLLSCVATQSIVISGYSTYGTSFPISWGDILLVLGLLLYVFNLGLIIYHYIRIRSTDLTENWNNTNCIIHGAVSITGVAFTFSHIERAYIIDILWVISFTLFLIVEIIEIFRFIQRVNKLGWKQGIFIYSPSQWARIFTFGMLLFFTKRIPTGNHVLIDSLQNIVFLCLPLLIVILVLIEIFLVSRQIYKNMMNKQHHIHLPNHENGRSFPR